MADLPQLPGISEDQARLWAKCEDVAMHFNELIMNFRLKALGGVTLAGGLIGTVLLAKKEALPLSWMNNLVFAGAMVLLTILWQAIRAIDFGYYQGLLRGAVDEILRLEGETGGRIQLSKKIESAVAMTRDSAADKFHRLPTYAFVGAAASALSVAAVLWDSFLSALLPSSLFLSLCLLGLGDGFRKPLRKRGAARITVGMPFVLMALEVFAVRALETGWFANAFAEARQEAASGTIAPAATKIAPPAADKRQRL